MKLRYATTIIVTFWVSLVAAQDAITCEQIVLQTYQAINQKDAGPVMKHLSDNFTIAGHTGHIAKLVLPQLFNQLGRNVTGVKKLSQTSSNVLTMVYEAEFGDMGIRQSTFLFNDQNQIESLELLPMQVMAKEGQAVVHQSDAPWFTIPFKKVGNLVGVEVHLNGVSRTFLLDNGAPVLVLNSAHLAGHTPGRKLGVSDVKGAGGNISNVGLEQINSFAFGGITMDRQSVMSIDLSHLETETGTTFYGLLGYEIYKNYDLLFDYNQQTVTFIKPWATQEFLQDRFTGKQWEVPITMGGHIPIVEGVINGKNYTFGIDCGAEASLFDLRLQEELKSNLANLENNSLSGADKNVREILSGKLDSLEIGGLAFHKTQTSFSDISHLNNGYKLKLDGLIGYDILSNQPTLISFINKKVVFIQ